ncbi:AAA family ATPase [Thalassovita mangrovi]|uniref:AAA family ATPase n=1 Tax=Thalassovita mangrovi TaxID=2692236 RepID=A0A6L8LKW0_9RHOB|nr:AAA family ATPase [Thalassovita mangrovi]MYM55130.1 AAA family ATPase [Thalassovita mangrovi]
MERLGIVVSGLPASGKTQLGRRVSEALDLPFLDKDDFLESLYECEGVGDWAWRQSLSRKADALFQAEAEELSSAVLVSHWRPTNADSKSGTPTDWIAGSFSQIIELYCECPPALATERFFRRSRHPGHLDHTRDRQELAVRMREFAQHYPLGVGPVVSVSTEHEVNIAELADRILSASASKAGS